MDGEERRQMIAMEKMKLAMDRADSMISGPTGSDPDPWREMVCELFDACYEMTRSPIGVRYSEGQMKTILEAVDKL